MHVRVCILIPTHALPLLSYRVPESLVGKVDIGAAVVAPLSGHSRLGIVVGETLEEVDLGEIRSVTEWLSLPAGVVELCKRTGRAAAIPLAAALRSALPPGLRLDLYRVLDPLPEWPLPAGNLVSRSRLRNSLGGEVLRSAEEAGRLELAPSLPERGTAEWAVVQSGAAPDLRHARRQREIFEALERHGGVCRTSVLLPETGANREALRRLVRRSAVRLRHHPEPPPVLESRGESYGLDPELSRGAGRVVERGGGWLWRTPTGEQAEAVAALARAAVERGGRVLILAPEVEVVDRLVQKLAHTLPAGTTVAPYHSGLGRDRTAVYEAVRDGGADVLVGTRTAALFPVPDLTAICVVDEPNEAHRAEPGYEGVPMHVRDLALERARIQDASALFLSPFPSLRLYARKSKLRELPARSARDWPGVRIVDLRGSGATVSSALLDACRRSLESGERVGVVVNRLGYSASLCCNRCGAVRRCPVCDLPFSLHQAADALVCGRCGHREQPPESCGECGSGRLSPTGLAVEMVREELSSSLGRAVGLLTADSREAEDEPVAVGTARCVLERQWDLVILPDLDTSLFGSGMGATERAFRTLYRAAESARSLLLVQTRAPEHYALRAALRGDYPAFAAAELPRMRSLGYPPYAHLAELELAGTQSAVWRAVESELRPSLGSGVEMSSPLLLSRGEGSAWRLLLRSDSLAEVARAGTLAARIVAGSRGKDGLKVRVDIDPEEV